ncbi:hypothetical protein T265_11143 [Opisthorchis viverrini]|uniref:PH domain protein n=1 Tax=Opisthorchis viverrini TaxID=6198 RepID=A0A074ZAL3_OPIVI|nr:hypothetical protein T265_11143 [Opisthorchis viverrini]KER20260.1 hypothetical protein T265_11143 [Opisthorchis viverrini]
MLSTKNISVLSFHYSEYRQFDLRIRQDHLRDPRINVCDQASTSIGLLTGAKQRATKCPSTGWQPLNFEQQAKFDLSKGLSQRAPLLSAIPRPQQYQIPQGTNRDIPASDSTTRTSTGVTQFSVSFEGISESGPMGTRLSPVGSSCWSSEQHISQDSSSLISGSTNSVSAGRSMSSGKQQTVQGHAPNPLQRQPSSGTAGSGGNYSLDTHHLQSASHSVRSAPLCLGSPIQTRYFRQLTLDTQPNPQQGGPTPPSLVVSDPEEEQHRRTLQIYVFAVRCVAYPILSPITQGPTRRYLRVNKDYLLTLKERFQGLPKIHKPDVPVRPIVDGIGSPPHELARFLAGILKPLTEQSSAYIKYSYDFANKVTGVTVEPDDILVSFDVNSLYTNVPKGDSLEIAKRLLLADTTLSERTQLTVDEIVEGIKACLNLTHFVFDSVVYTQEQGLSMGSLISPVLANIFMEEFEQRALAGFPYPPRIFWRYVDDTFVVMKRDKFSEFYNYLNELSPEIKLMYEKPIDTGGVLNYLSAHPKSVFASIASSMLRRVRALCIEEADQTVAQIEFQNQQLIEGLSRENVISAWKIKFDQICRGGERPCPVAMKLAVPQPEVVSPTKEQLYELLMRTLSVEKYEHQVLFNACQLDNADEQAAQIRRELSERLSLIEKMARERSYPKLVHKEMESQYIDEERLRVNELIRRVDAIPVIKSYAGASGQVQRRFRKKTIRGMLSKFDDSRVSKSEIELNAEADLWSKQYGIESASVRGAFGSSSAISEQIMPTKELIAGTLHGHGISREAIRMNFSLDILIHQLRNVRNMANKRLYCTVELDGTADKKRTETVEARSPVWDTTAEFQTFQPLPLAKVRLHKECSGPLSLEDKEIGKIVLYPCWTSPRVPTWFRLLPTKHCHDILELQISVTMRRPTNCKYANHCWIQGRTTFKKWKRRYICLIQVSQYTFVLAAYGEQKSHPTEFMALDGFTVDYCESRPELTLANSASRTKPDHNVSSSSLNSLSKLRLLSSIVRPSSQQHNEDSSSMSRPEADGVASFFFKLVREGDSVIVATSTEVDRQSWVQAIYRATGQTHKPSMPGHPASSLSTRTPVREFEGSRHSGIEELATTPVYSVDHFDFFCELQAQSLNQRLQVSGYPGIFYSGNFRKDSFVSLGWPSPGQKMLLEEYCARYGIRECQRHLAFLKNLLDKAEHGVQIDPDLFHLSYSLCANHVTGKTQHAQAVHTVLAVEREQFQYIKQRLTTLLEKQITEFRYCFPFGRPEGALEKTISLLERVLTKETGEPASADLVRNTIKTCLRNAAVLNYERISEYATIEAVSGFRIQDGHHLQLECKSLFVSLSSSFLPGVDAANKRMYEMIHLAELCIEVLKQNEEHHAEVSNCLRDLRKISFSWFSDLFVAHAENFWSLFQMDLFDFLDQLPDYRWEIFELFQLLNDYLLNDTNLCNGHFHQNLANRFAPLVDSYIELMAEMTEQALITGYQNERWLPSITVVAGAGRMEVLPNGDTQSGLKVHPPLVATGSAPYTDNVATFAGTDAMKQRLSVNLGAQQHSPGEFRRSLGGNFQNPLFSISGLPFTSEPFACPESSSGMVGSRACQTVIELLWRLHKLKYFVQELAWPQPVKAKDLSERIRVLCAQMLREGVKRTLIELESTVRKCSKNTDLILPIECCTMLNTVTELRSHLFSLCHSMDTSNSLGSPTKGTTQNANQLHIETEEFFEGVHRNMLVIVVDQLVAVLNGVLGKLTRFDENKLLSSLLSLTVLELDYQVVNTAFCNPSVANGFTIQQKPTDEEGRAYSVFVHNNLQQLNDNLVDEVSLISLCENWYNRQIRMLYEWLVHRKSILLHPYQIKCLSVIVKKTFSYFELQGLPKSVLDTIMYQTVSHRLQVDETTQCVRQETGSMPPSGKGKRKVLDNLSGGISALSGSAIFRRN